MPQAPGYGSIDSAAAAAAAEEAAGAVRPNPSTEPDGSVDLEYNRGVARRWRNLAPRAALALGAAAVLGFSFTSQPSSSGAPSLVEVAPAAREELAPLSFEAHNFYLLKVQHSL